MLYVIVAEDSADSPQRRPAARPAHMERMSKFQATGKLVISGPVLKTDHPDPAVAGIAGSVIIAEFESLAAAQAWANADPYVAAGAWSKVTVQPYHKGFGK